MLVIPVVGRWQQEDQDLPQFQSEVADSLAIQDPVSPHNQGQWDGQESKALVTWPGFDP